MVIRSMAGFEVDTSVLADNTLGPQAHSRHYLRLSLKSFKRFLRGTIRLNIIRLNLINRMNIKNYLKLRDDCPRSVAAPRIIPARSINTPISSHVTRDEDLRDRVHGNLPCTDRRHISNQITRIRADIYLHRQMAGNLVIYR